MEEKRLQTLDDLVRHRLPDATEAELEVAKEHVRSFLRAAIRQFGNLPAERDKKKGTAILDQNTTV